MKSISCSLYLITSLVVFDYVSTIAHAQVYMLRYRIILGVYTLIRMAFELQLNTFDFERGELKMMPNTGVKLIKFIAKKVNRTAMDLELEATLNRTYGSGFSISSIQFECISKVFV